MVVLVIIIISEQVFNSVLQVNREKAIIFTDVVPKFGATVASGGAWFEDKAL